MPDSIFSGTSSGGDISEALQNAIQSAKEGLRSSLIHWTIESIGGESGGVVDINNVKVVIKANPPK